MTQDNDDDIARLLGRIEWPETPQNLRESILHATAGRKQKQRFMRVRSAGNMNEAAPRPQTALAQPSFGGQPALRAAVLAITIAAGIASGMLTRTVSNTGHRASTLAASPSTLYTGAGQLLANDYGF